MTLPRSIASLGRSYRHLGRYRQILAVLARHGFGELIGRLPIRRYVEIAWAGGEADREIASLRAAHRLRLAFAELGPTFVKLGQLLSTRSDLIPLELTRELAVLQDQASTFLASKARALIEQEIGKPISELFAEFEDTPIAAASLAQVHRARLRDDGRMVAVKIQRPGVRQMVAIDFEILRHLASIAEQHGEGSLFAQRPHEIIAELSTAIEQELDYTREAAHLKRFGRLFADDPTVKIPEVVAQLTTPRILTMEWLEGRKVTRLVAEGAEPATLEAVARRGADAVLRQIFVFGLYHSDPHPGNIFVLDDGVIAFLDFGQIGRLSSPMRALLAEFFVFLTRDDIESAVSAFLELTSANDTPTAVERHRLEAEIAELVDWHLDRPLGEAQLASLIWRLLEIAGRPRRRVRGELFLVLKSLATLDGLVREISPAFDLRSQAGPFLEEVLRQRWSVAALQRTAWESGREISEILQNSPRDLQRLLSTLERGELRIETQISGLENLHKAHEGALNRLSFAVVLAALLIASSLLALGDFPDWWQGLPLLGVAGYVLAGLIGFRLLWSFFRKGGL